MTKYNKAIWAGLAGAILAAIVGAQSQILAAINDVLLLLVRPELAGALMPLIVVLGGAVLTGAAAYIAPKNTD